MSNYILIHGGSRDATIWEKVRPLLEAQDHNVYCPSLSNPEKSNLTDHIQEVCNIIDKYHLHQIILVGHSYGGMVITGVADKRTDKLKQLIYIDSVFPENEKSLFDIIDASGLKAIEDYGLDPFKSFIEPIHFEYNKLKKIPKLYILCSQSEFIKVSKFAYQKVLTTLPEENWQHCILNTFHSPMLTLPKQLADIFLKY